VGFWGVGLLGGCTQKTHRVFFGYIPGCLNPDFRTARTPATHKQALFASTIINTVGREKSVSERLT